MCAENLEHAIDLVNQTGYGLTSGLESLDNREHDVWKKGIKAGNLYINRGTTGAITLRQPFGGMGKSALGPGLKAGGPDYVSQFMRFVEIGYPKVGVMDKDHELLRMVQQWQRKINWGQLEVHREDILKTIRAVKSYLFHAEKKFSQEEDYFHFRGQDNIMRYLPVGHVVIRLHENDSLFDVLGRLAAAKISGCTTTVSIPKGGHNASTAFLDTHEGREITGSSNVIFQDDTELIHIMPEIQRIRYAAPDRVPVEVLTAAAKLGFYISRTPVMMEGRIELLQYYQQQSICNNYHRYGNLGERAL
jgi:RHH-type proline utilization regulon transcriptional repressor/proline dehydrogenase/delta 1-pyrroline-5-carboxylate dehydrogenase